MQLVLFWIVTGLVAFGWALSVQMRIMVALVLRRALAAQDPALQDRHLANPLVVRAAADAEDEDRSVRHLRESYPAALRHLRRARWYSLVLPVCLLLTLGVGRFGLGVM